MYDCLSKPITLRLPDGFGLGTLEPYQTLISSLSKGFTSALPSRSGLLFPPVLMGDLPGLTLYLSTLINIRRGSTGILSCPVLWLTAKSLLTMANSNRVNGKQARLWGEELGLVGENGCIMCW